MIWFWLCLLSGLILGLLILGGLLADRWWWRRKARKRAEALVRFKASDPYQRFVRDFTAAATAVGEQMLPAFTSFAVALNRAAPELEKITAAVKAAEPDPDAPTR